MEPKGSADPATEGEIGILQRRKIEAAIIAPIYEGMVREIGEERAQAILDEAISKAAIAAAKSFADKTEGGADLLTFQALQSLWTKDDALQIEVVRADDISTTTSPVAATPKPTATWASARSGICCPATVTASFARATIPTSR